jgi:hypothetical protein
MCTGQEEDIMRATMHCIKGLETVTVFIPTFLLRSQIYFYTTPATFVASVKST